MKPLIGVTPCYSRHLTSIKVGNYEITRNDLIYLASNYTEAILKAGGIPVIIPPSDNPHEIREYVDKLDGLILSGGEDVNPALSNKRPQKYNEWISPERDFLELNLIESFLEAKKPIMGICRGLQILNIYKGGTLIQDLITEGYPIHNISINYRENYSHEVDIKEGSTLSEIFKVDRIGVNSFHHQAVENLGEGLVATAFSEEGLIEAYESSDMDEQFILALQWHPEALAVKHNEHQEIFNYFVDKLKNDAKH